MIKKVPLFVKIIIGMILGIIVGIIIINSNTTDFAQNWIKPWGEIFMRLLKLIAVPLVFISLIKGVTNLGNIRSLSTLGLRVVILYVLTTIIAITFGATIAYLIKPGEIISAEASETLQQSYDLAVTTNAAETSQELLSPLAPIVNIFPENLFSALANNGSMLQVIAIAILIGIAALMVGKEHTTPFNQLVNSLEKIIIKLVDIIMKYAPIGVFSLITMAIVDSAGDLSLLSALGLYFITVVAALLLFIILFYPLIIHFFTKIPTLKFMRIMFPVQLIGFSTSSSAATLPLTMDTATTKLGIKKETASFVLPVGMTINMDGTSCYQVIAAIFIAQIFGIDLSLSTLISLIAVITLSSIGTPGIPGGSIVVLTMVLASAGIPIEGLALVMAVDRPLDMLRTSVNITGDVTVASIVDK